MRDLIVYKDFIKEIKALIYKRQYEAMKSVNKELLGLYWEIGEEINNQQKGKGWGKSVVEILARGLQLEFPGVKGFSARNLLILVKRNFFEQEKAHKIMLYYCLVLWALSLKILIITLYGFWVWLFV